MEGGWEEFNEKPTNLPVPQTHCNYNDMVNNRTAL